MKRTVILVVRGIVAVVVLGILVYTVNGWWREYKEAPRHGIFFESTSTVPGDGGGGQQASGEVVVVLVDGLNLREKPEADAKAIRGLNKGERLTLIKTEGAWYLVKTAEGDEGWTSSNPSYSKIEKK